MDFIQLSVEQILKALEGQENLLQKAVDQEESLLQGSFCPQCNSYDHERFVNPKTPFIKGSPLPNKILRCLSCQTEYDPRSGAVLRSSQVNPLP